MIVQSIQFGSTCITGAEIMYADLVVKNISNMSCKSKNYTPMQWNPILIFLQNLKYVGAMVTEFHFFNEIPKKKNIAILYILHTYYIKVHPILIGF